MLKRAFEFVRELLKPEVQELTPSDREIICLFAAGNTEFRVSALEIYQANIQRVGRTGDHMCFMSEIANPVPDAELRAYYRRRIIE